MVADREDEEPCRSAGEAAAATPAADGAAHAIAQMPWRIPLNPDRPTEPLPPEGVAAIHDAAMRVLEETGIDFLHPEAREILAAAGCAVDGVTVRMDRAFVMEQVAEGAAPVRHDPAQPGPPRHHGRRPHVLRQRLLAAQRHGPRPRPPGRQHGGLQELHAADAVLQLHPRRRRLPGRAGRRPRLGPPPRLPLREAHPHRQGRPRLQPRRRAGRGRDRDGPHRLRPPAGRVRDPSPASSPTSTPPRRSSTTPRCSTAPCASPAAASRSSSPPSRWPAPWPRSPWPAPSSSPSPRRWPPSPSCSSSAPASPA